MMKLRITVDGKAYDVDVEVLEDGGGALPASAPAPAVAAGRPATAPMAPKPSAPKTAAVPTGGGGAADVPSPIAGNVLDVKVKAGDTVAQNDVLLVLEAMKMETNVSSPRAGTVAEVRVKSGDAVTSGQVLVTFA
ncbi:MAG: biotin/lipoyl-containing protein [Phycisphaeraceae bacterium]